VGLNSSFLTADELRQLGFRKLGRDVRIHPSAVIVNCSTVSLGDHVRIDPFSVLSARQINVGAYVHISSHAALLGKADVSLHDFVNISPGARILTSNDDFSGRSLVGAMIPETLSGCHHADVIIERHAVIGAGTIILPGVTIGEGSSVGALSFVKRSLEAWGIYGGVPVRRINDRARDVLQLEAALRGFDNEAGPNRE